MLKKIKGVFVSIASGAALVAGQAYAAVPAEVTTAMTDMKADGVAVASGFLVATIVVSAFLFMRRGARA